jgi:hypothetical protein
MEGLANLYLKTRSTPMSEKPISPLRGAAVDRVAGVGMLGIVKRAAARWRPAVSDTSWGQACCCPLAPCGLGHVLGDPAERIADILDGCGTQASRRQLGEEPSGCHLEVAPAVGRGQVRKPALEHLVVVLGARRPRQHGDLDGWMLGLVTRHHVLQNAQKLGFLMV